METCITLRTSAPSVKALLPKRFVTALKKIRRHINLFVTVHNGHSEMTEQNAMQISKKRLFEQLVKIPGLPKKCKQFFFEQLQNNASDTEMLPLVVEDTESSVEFGTFVLR